jgi:hypothetical protein
VSVPSIPDGSTLAVYVLPWSTAESLIEDICDRMGLIRRLTIGGETKGKGRDKWGGGEKVVYGIEEVWEAAEGESEGELVSSDTCPDRSQSSALIGC